MRKRAKCKLCNTVVETKNNFDIWSCPCGEISIDRISGAFHANVKNDIDNLILVDNDGNEIIPKISSAIEDSEQTTHKIDKGGLEELLYILDKYAENLHNLPPEARQSPITHSDFGALITLLSSIFRAS